MNATRTLIQADTIRAWEAAAPSIGLKPHKVPLVAAKIDSSGECWEWTASVKANGYAQFNTGGRNWNAHRLVFLLAGHTIPEGYELDHLCRNRSCVNPNHLEAVTRAVNVRRQADVITECPQGHEYTIENTYVWKGLRHCRTCRANRNLEKRQRRQAALIF